MCPAFIHVIGTCRWYESVSYRNVVRCSPAQRRGAIAAIKRRHQPDVGARQRLADLQLQPRVPARQHDDAGRDRGQRHQRRLRAEPPDGAETGFDDDHRGDGRQQHAGQLARA